MQPPTRRRADAEFPVLLAGTAGAVHDTHDSHAGGGELLMATQTKKKKGAYVETPDYGSLFRRPDAEGKQPGYTGEGVLSDETLAAIKAAGGKFQIAGWLGRTDSGLPRMRVHIEGPYEADDDDDDEKGDDENESDIPF